MNEQDIYEKVKKSLEDFFREDFHLLDVIASERSISHKFAEHLQKQFSELNVDCEYNRHKDATKTLNYVYSVEIKPDDLEARTVFPDIIVHKRGNDEANLLVIEIKKANSSRDVNQDIEKLKAFTGNQYKYEVGLFLAFDLGGRRVCDVRCIKNGKEEENTIWSNLKDLWHGV